MVLLEQLRSILTFYSRSSLTYQLVNEYIYHQQLAALSHSDPASGQEQRIRMDENLKLCLMPLAVQRTDSPTRLNPIQPLPHSAPPKHSKVKDVVFRENDSGS